MSSFIYITSTIVIIGSILALLFFIIKLVSALCKESNCISYHEKADATMSRLDNTIMLSVMTINKSMVEERKKSNSFLQKDKEEAFQESKDRIMNILSNEDLQHLSIYIDNMEEWIDNRIEYYVRVLKKNK
ncbi:hypothetical protein [Alkaliphilus peptidifermentans]|uniref:Uncharacterized protein n=1 Tax=Alkaliphilus peptidifermentans DSM 18978 TaxID=1120976 RepID=A0A1G5KMX5_9FIRM|nr:hypothetical protein [Alkaliphilus peptidifermentans]SCZ01694.1 hypothetical protein SAMN03080606_03597 [Alkaliphilus peptidifermentans DSM 18978]